MTNTLVALKTLPAVELTFPVGLPGLDAARLFRLEPLGGEGMNIFGRLQSLVPVPLRGGGHAEELSLIVAAPGLLWPDYAVEVPDEAAAILGLEDPSDAVALVIVTLGEDFASSTANLFAPLVVNTVQRLGMQVVPDRNEEEIGWSLHAPLPLPEPV